MKKQIELQGGKIEYTLKESTRARRMRLTMYRGGGLVVTAPQMMNEHTIEQFIIKKAKWVFGKLEYFKKLPKQTLQKNSKKDYHLHKERARKLVKDRVGHFNEIYRFKFNTISIRNQKTRWGSCSRKGNLNFNYKIIHLSPHLADYLVVHELCHLKEFNHSQKFWDLVAITFVDYRKMRSELRRGTV